MSWQLGKREVGATRRNLGSYRNLSVTLWWAADTRTTSARYWRELIGKFRFSFGTRSQENQHHVQESSAVGEIPISREKMQL